MQVAPNINPAFLLSESLLHLGREQVLDVPYDPLLEPVVYTIADNNVLWHEGTHRILGPLEVPLLNYLRLAQGQPVMRCELFRLVYSDNNRGTGRSRYSYLKTIADKLNNSLSSSTAQPRHVLVSDSNQPAIIRPVRSIRFIDERKETRDDDWIRKQFAFLHTETELPKNLPKRPGSYPPEIAASTNYAVLQAVGAVALQHGIVSLRDMFTLSIRHGRLGFLHGTLLPLPDRQRLAYDKLFPNYEDRPPANMSYIAAVLRSNRNSTKSLGLRAMRKLNEFAARYPFPEWDI
jgi:hypothetical protein